MPIQLKSVGGGQIVLDVPNTASNYTVTLPASNATVLNSDSTLDATKLTGAVPTGSLTNANGRLIGYQVFTASGTYSKATNNPSFIIVEVVGAGGQGGTLSASSVAQVSSGGGSGGYARKTILASALSASETVTTGTNGGTSSFGTHCSATGGTNGSITAPNVGLGGLGTGGDINIAGNNATYPSNTAGPTSGAASIFGGGGRPGTASATASVAAFFGAGSGGVLKGAVTAVASGGATTGVVIVWEYA